VPYLSALEMSHYKALYKSTDTLRYFTVTIIAVTSPAGAVAKYCDVCVCLFVCPRWYLRNHTRDLYQFLCTLPMSVARSSSGMLTIGRIAYRRKGDDGSAQRGRSVQYDWLVIFRVSRRWREMYRGHGRLCVCLSLATFPHYCMDPNVTWRNGWGCPVVVHFLADLQSVRECVAMTT